jgi:hypothetical protein
MTLAPWTLGIPNSLYRKISIDGIKLSYREATSIVTNEEDPHLVFALKFWYYHTQNE